MVCYIFHKPQFIIHDFAMLVFSGQHLNFLALNYCYFILYENELMPLYCTRADRLVSIYLEGKIKLLWDYLVLSIMFETPVVEK